MYRRDPTLNQGCKNCKNYTGKYPVNVFNFKCAKGEKNLHVYICMQFKKSKK